MPAIAILATLLVFTEGADDSWNFDRPAGVHDKPTEPDEAPADDGSVKELPPPAPLAQRLRMCVLFCFYYHFRFDQPV